MKRIATVIIALLAMCSATYAQSAGNCVYQPSLDKELHTPDTVYVTFSDYKSVRLTSPEDAFAFVYRTSLEEKSGKNSLNAIQYLATKNNMKVTGNTLRLTPYRYHVPTPENEQAKRNARRKGWGTDDNDYLRFAIPAGTLTATDAAGVDHVLDSISFQYVYTDAEDPDRVPHNVFEYRLDPAVGETVTGLGEFLLEFPYCPGVFTLNYDQTVNPYVIDSEGNVVTSSTRSLSLDYNNAGKITLKNRVTKAGDYTLVIPEASYHMSPSLEEWADSLRHPEIRAQYKVLGEESMAWESVPANGSTVAKFDGIFLSFPGKTIASRATNLNGGNLKVYNKADDKYAAMSFMYYFSKIVDNRLCFTTAGELSKVKDGVTYYFEVPYGLVTFDDGTVSDGFKVEFTYDSTYDPNNVVKVQDNYVGYTTSAVYRKDGVRFNSGSEQGMLIRLPKEKTAMLAGSKIKAIRTATGTSQMDNPRLVIIEGDDVNATPVVEQATSKFSTTMKDYALDTPYEIKGEKALYVGIKCSLSAAYNPMLFDETLDLPDGLAWALTANGWTDISRQGYGAPNIQILVDENIASNDVLVKPFFTGVYNKMGEPMSISTQVFNYGANEVTDFDVTYKIGAAKEVNRHVEGISLKQGEAYDLVIEDVDLPAAGRLPLDVKVSKVNGKADKDMTDNAQSSKPYIYPADSKKKILFEEFTGMNCVNCPAAVIAINEVLSEIPGQSVEVYHHAGFNPDNFTLAEDMEYTWFYSKGGGTFAPGGMVNRMPLTAEATSVVFESNSIANVRAGVNAALNVAPYVGLTMNNDFDDANRTGKVTIDVMCYELPTNELHALNVWLVQDNVMRYQKGAGLVAHNHAMRMSLTGYWGKQIELAEGASNTYSFEYSIPEVITGQYAKNVLATESEADNKDIKAIPTDMRIVAFVSDVTENPLTCNVWNVEECAVSVDETGIINLTQTNSKKEVYDLQGRKVSKMAHGLYIINGKKVAK